MTTFIDWVALAASTPKEEIKFRPLAGKQIKYVDARFVMDRLDSIVGHERWEFAWSAVCMPTDKHPGCIKGTLTIKYGDNLSQQISKSDVGEYEVSKMSSMKGGVSDALKRCAVQFGIGRDLYDDDQESQVQTTNDAKKIVQEVFPGTVEVDPKTIKSVSKQTEIEKATEPQLKYLTSLSERFKFVLPIPHNISKKEASELIKKYSEMTKSNMGFRIGSEKHKTNKVNLNDPNTQVDIPF